MASLQSWDGRLKSLVVGTFYTLRVHGSFPVQFAFAKMSELDRWTFYKGSKNKSMPWKDCIDLDYQHCSTYRFVKSILSVGKFRNYQPVKPTYM